MQPNICQNILTNSTLSLHQRDIFCPFKSKVFAGHEISFSLEHHTVCPYSLNKAFPVALQNIFHETIKIPEITAIFMDPCSSRAILSASSINSIPKPWEPHKKNTVHSQASTNSCQLTTTYLMLEFRWITSTDRNHTAVTMATRSRNKLISNCTIAPNLIGQKKIN